jgi:hypothetical protein
MAAQFNKRTAKNLSTSTTNKILVSLLNGIPLQQAMGRGQQMKWEGKCKGWLQR